MTQYSISEVQQLVISQRPIYAKNDVIIYDTVVIKPKPVLKNNKFIKAKGFLGITIGFAVENGIIYFRVDDINIYNDGIAIYVEANKNSITINQADAPKPTVSFFDNIDSLFGGGINNFGSGLKSLATTGLLILGAVLLIRPFIKASSQKILNK